LFAYLAYIYLSFVIVQLALFNVILMGLFVIAFAKLQDFIAGYLIKVEVKFQNKGFEEFLKAQNEKPAFKNASVNVTGSNQGMTLEFHHPEHPHNSDTPTGMVAEVFNK
jgi:hypothetical protein